MNLSRAIFFWCSGMWFANATEAVRTSNEAYLCWLLFGVFLATGFLLRDDSHT